mgnify:CR=1 FL=1
MAKQAGITGNALEALMQLESDLSSFEDIQKEWENNPSGSHAEDTKRTAQNKFWKDKIRQDKKNVKKYANTEVKTGGGSGGTGANVDSSDPNKILVVAEITPNLPIQKLNLTGSNVESPTFKLDSTDGKPSLKILLSNS